LVVNKGMGSGMLGIKTNKHKDTHTQTQRHTHTHKHTHTYTYTHKIDKKGNLLNSVSAMSKVSKVPITVKVRTGRDEKSPTLHKFISEFESYGASALQIHGRSRLQRYTKVKKKERKKHDEIEFYFCLFFFF